MIENVPTQKPKFAIDDIVKHPPSLYKETTGKVTEIRRSYLEVDDNGNFIKRGLLTTEDTIKSIVLPYTFDGNILTVHVPEQSFGKTVFKAHTIVSKFYCYSYVVRTKKMNCVFSESSLKLTPKKQLAKK